MGWGGVTPANYPDANLESETLLHAQPQRPKTLCFSFTPLSLNAISAKIRQCPRHPSLYRTGEWRVCVESTEVLKYLDFMLYDLHGDCGFILLEPLITCGCTEPQAAAWGHMSGVGNLSCGAKCLSRLPSAFWFGRITSHSLSWVGWCFLNFQRLFIFTRSSFLPIWNEEIFNIFMPINQGLREKQTDTWSISPQSFFVHSAALKSDWFFCL